MIMKTRAVVAIAVLGLLEPAWPQDDRGRRPRRRREDRWGERRGERRRDERPRERRPREGGGYSIEQAISDRAQLTTIAFDGLAFLTGNLGSDTLLPPGKVSDYFGFQYMRDVDKAGMGHNTSFVDKSANNVLYILNRAQKAQLVALGKEQEGLLREFALMRFPLIKAFRRELDGDIPAGSDGLNREAVMKYAADLFEIDGLLAYQRAQVLGGIIQSLNDEQKAYLSKMVFDDTRTWPERRDLVDRRSMPRGVHVAVMTYASEMFSWYAGSIEADVYFCPERHATYFGSFYMKGRPVMGKRNASISTSLTADSGDQFLDILTASQRRRITELVELQRNALREIVSTRRKIAVELRRFIKGDTPDQGRVLELSRRYGELDGEISYYYATRFAAVGGILTDAQKQKLMRLRNLDGDTCRGAYLYSRPIATPDIINTDFLFGVSAK